MSLAYTLHVRSVVILQCSPKERLILGVAALLAKYKGPAMEKPVIRPYTPTSDEGECSPATVDRIMQQC